jgi:hypothetical protein
MSKRNLPLWSEVTLTPKCSFRAAAFTMSYSSFTATTRGMVQVGGVYTPAELRGRGYGRAVVAGSLRDARKAGSRRSVLFYVAREHRCPTRLLRSGLPGRR